MAKRSALTVQMNVAEAKAKLSKLLAAVDAGEEVIIARGGFLPRALFPSPSRPCVLVFSRVLWIRKRSRISSSRRAGGVEWMSPLDGCRTITTFAETGEMLMAQSVRLSDDVTALSQDEVELHNRTGKPGHALGKHRPGDRALRRL
jgi:antitoxin (DNA-binding transcriptional repressor) of toxin-antitoxin stability system